MKRVMLIVVFFVFASGLQAQTVVSGPVTGVWTAENNPYIVSNHIDPNGVYIEDSLIIDEGVVVQFDAGLSLAVGNGDKFVARGTVENRIIFEALNVHQPGIWNEISLVNSSNNDTLEYCDIRDANTGIYSHNSTIFVNYCNIFGNFEYGVYVHHHAHSADSSMIANCRIFNNVGDAGIRLYVSVEVYYHTAIASLKIYRSTIYNNSGYGVLIGTSTGYYNGTARARGRITNCTISNNDSAAVFANGPSGESDATITNSIMAFSGGYGIDNGSHAYIDPDDVINSCFWENQLGDFNNIVGEGFGQNGPFENYNGDSCDINLNIYYDPCFVDTSSADYNLLAESNCIDAGTPIVYGEYILDPDGTHPEIGSHYFPQPTSITEEYSILPMDFAISQNYPNPFNATTIIQYHLPKAGNVRIDICDILGRKAETLYEGIKQAGLHSITWDAGDHSSGIYFYRIQAGDYAETRKMVLLK